MGYIVLPAQSIAHTHTQAHLSKTDKLYIFWPKIEQTGRQFEDMDVCVDVWMWTWSIDDVDY